MKKKEIKIFLQRFIAWAESQPNMLGVAIVGSYARDEFNADSDLDLIVIALQHLELIRNQSWVNKFGTVKFSQVEDYGLVTSLRVKYKEGPEVEYGFTSSAWTNSPIDDGTKQVIRSGIKILLDKKELLSQALNEVLST